MSNQNEYEIPHRVINDIPEYFWAAFVGELCGIFGPCILERVDDSWYFIQDSTGTSGWHTAFKAACFKTECDWLYLYWEGLSWMEGDKFGSEIANMVVEKFIEADHSGASPYYMYLLRKHA